MYGKESEDNRRAWDRIAPGYDRTNTPTQMWLGNEGLRRAGLRAGMQFLDVAAGSGALSIPAARLGAHVLASSAAARSSGTGSCPATPSWKRRSAAWA